MASSTTNPEWFAWYILHDKASDLMSKLALICLSVLAVVTIGVVLAWRLFDSAEIWADPDDRNLVALGQSIYVANCADCQGVNLEGQPNWRHPKADGTLPGPPHDDSGHTWHHPDDVLFTITKKGGQHLAPSGFLSGMPGFEQRLSDKEIFAALAYIKSRWSDDVRARQAQMN